MNIFFEYNWQVREEWFDWCSQISQEKLVRERIGGVGSILRTLVHIVDVEQSWIRGLMGVPEFHYKYDDYTSLESVRNLSDKCRLEIKDYISEWSEDEEKRQFNQFTYAEVIRHVIAHEIHHIGQLSIWSRELGLTPISANFIRRGLGQGVE
ncbi:DinB family protein [Paenibacillus sp. SN-8-1]|uniref:DinB family protein n=1 Tax=Paenibacillus sp. SN-8-1 TaxID=3435409 RepID=UPI003D9A9A64